MPFERHQWIADHHAQNPFALSLLKPLTIADSADEDVEWTPPGHSEPETLAASRHDFIFPYRNFASETKLGHGRLWLPESCDGAQRSTPLVLSIHYQGDINLAKGFLSRGIAFMTPIDLPPDHGANLVGDGMDHTLAMGQLARRLEFVDLNRIGWTGGSAGGYQCLMTLEALWPVACAEANVPLSDLSYNLRYIRHANRWNLGIEDVEAMPIPIVHFVQGIADGSIGDLGDDVDRAWQHSVPPGASLIKSPTLIHTCTGDLLCPSAQIGADYERAVPRGTFPPGFTQNYDRFCNDHSLHKPLLEWFDRNELETFSIGIPKTTRLVDPIPPDQQKVPPPEPTAPVFEAPKPYSRDRLVSVVVQDEGPPLRTSGHSRYVVGLDHKPFFDHHLGRGYVPAEHLTPVVLTRLLGRFSESVPQNDTLPPLRRLLPLHDRWDVLLSLETFVGSQPRNENVRTLSRVYSELPPVARALDVRYGDVEARFADEPVAGLLFHKAALLRESGEDRSAEELAAQLGRNHSDTPWARLTRQV